MYHSFEHCNITPHQHNQSHLIFPFNIHAPKMIKDTHVKYICNLVISCSKHWVEEMSIYPSSHFVKSMAKPWCWQNISLLLIWKELYIILKVQYNFKTPFLDQSEEKLNWYGKTYSPTMKWMSLFIYISMQKFCILHCKTG